MSMKQLPSSTVKRITSSQIITSVSTALKELVENALDAEATNIDIKLENNGLDRIEVKDDGCGIKKTDTPNMCLSSFTSKLCEYSDLEKLHTYGFRGEALNALCHVANVTVTTRTREDDLAMMYTLDNSGHVILTKPSHFVVGTLVTVNGLFRNLPVRKQYLNSGRRAAEELKRSEITVKSLAVIHPGLRVTFCHNKCLLWQKSSCTTLRQSLMQIVGHSVSSQLEELVIREEKLSIYMLVPRKETENSAALYISNIDYMMLYINNRPVRFKKLEKMIVKYIAECFSDQLPAHKYPYCLVSIVTSPGEMDVNLEPNKTRVLLKEEEEVLAKIQNLLASYYGVKNNVQQVTDIRRIIETSDNEVMSLKVASNQPSCEEQQARKCKRIKLDTERDAKLNRNDFSSNKVQNVSVVMTPFGKEIFQGEVDTELVKNVRDKERELFVGNLETLNNCNKTLESGPYDETLTTNASELSKSGWTVTKNTYINNSQDSDHICSSGEIDINDELDAGSSNLGNLKINHKELVDNIAMTSQIQHNNKLLDVPNRENGSLLDANWDILPESTELQNGESEEAGHSMDRIGQKCSNTALIDTGFLKSVVQETLQNTVKSNEKPLQTMCNDVKHNSELDFIFGSDFDEDIEFTLLKNSRIDAATEDSCGMNQKCKEIASDKQPSSTDKLDTIHEDCVDISLPATSSVLKATDVSVEKWSKGQVKAPNGKLMQGSSVLLRKPTVARKPFETFDSSGLSVCSQMGQKEQKAFTKFSRMERPKILQEFPHLVFTKVAELLVERWQALPIEDHLKYEKMAKEVTDKCYYTSKDVKNLNRSGEKLTTIKSFLNKDKKSLRRQNRKKEILDVSFEKLKESDIIIHRELRYESSIPSLIGQLKPTGIWLYKRGKEFGIVRHWGLQETVLYHKLMLDHTVPLKKLESTIPIDERTLGPELWKVLLSLSRTYDVITNTVTITSDVILKNGFKIEILEGSGRTCCSLTEVASTLSFYGIHDLKDVLELTRDNGTGCLVKCRSTRVTTYIRSEAVRIVRQCPNEMERSTLQDLIQYWHSNLHHLGDVCLHRKPLFYTLSDVLETKGDL